MPKVRTFIWMLSIVTFASGVGAVYCQDYPRKPIRIVTTEAGSGNDLVARIIAQRLSVGIGQQVIVDNRGLLAAEIVAKAEPDGYTLLAYGSPLWLAPLLRGNVPYDPVRDFSPVTAATQAPGLLVINPAVPAKTVAELINLAKATPGQLNYGSASTGGPPHLSGELFKTMASINIVRIPYKGTGQALNALIGKEVQLMFPNAGSAMPYVKAGRLRALAVTSAQASALVPGLPTVAATLPGYESVAIQGIFAPAKTPVTLINRLNREIVQVLNRAEVKEILFKAATETLGSSPQQLAATIKVEMAKWGKVIKDAGIHED